MLRYRRRFSRPLGRDNHLGSLRGLERSCCNWVIGNSLTLFFPSSALFVGIQHARGARDLASYRVPRAFWSPMSFPVTWKIDHQWALDNIVFRDSTTIAAIDLCARFLLFNFLDNYFSDEFLFFSVDQEEAKGPAFFIWLKVWDHCPLQLPCSSAKQ